MISSWKNTIVKNTFETHVFLKEEDAESQLSDISSPHGRLHFTVHPSTQVPCWVCLSCTLSQRAPRACPFDLSFFYLDYYFFFHYN